jgi:D-tyrosyl-tRNA(Tyr) deacylase
MRAVLQRVSQASVEVDGSAVARIGAGMVVLLAIAKADTAADADFLSTRFSTFASFPTTRAK